MSAWIAVRIDLADDPAVVAIAASLNLPRQHVVGCLHAVWAWFDAHTASGQAAVKAAFIDELAGVPGFAKAMESAGWLSVTGDTVNIPRFGRHMSKSAKKRAQTARRVARHRQRKCNAGSVTAALPTAENSRAEKRTVEKPDSAGGRPAASTPKERFAGRRQKGPVALGCLVGDVCADAAGAVAKTGPNPSSVVTEIQCTLGDCGCDASFRGVVARCADIRIVRQLAARFDREKAKIANPGGWWRTELRRAGVKGIEQRAKPPAQAAGKPLRKADNSA